MIRVGRSGALVLDGGLGAPAGEFAGGLLTRAGRHGAGRQGADAILPRVETSIPTCEARQDSTPAGASTRVDAPQAQEAQLRAWVSAIAAQDQRALGELYDATVGRVYGLALRITRSRPTAEEVAEDVFMQVWREAQRFDAQKANVLGWLLMMCRSRALDALRRADEAQSHPEPETLVAELPDHASPEALLSAAQSGSRLHAALQELSALQRQLLGLAFFRGLSHEEIAAQMAMPLGTVKSHIRRALLVLKERLQMDQVL